MDPPCEAIQRRTGGQYYYGTSSATRIGGVRLGQVAFPSAKFHMYDTHTRHGKRPLYFAHEDAAQPVLQFDTAVLFRRTAESGQGWRPNFPDFSRLFSAAKQVGPSNRRGCRNGCHRLPTWGRRGAARSDLEHR